MSEMSEETEPLLWKITSLLHANSDLNGLESGRRA
jgi:hypothetical protein